VTIALIGVNVLAFGMAVATSGSLPGPAPFAHRGLGPFVTGLLVLWLFGDNVEARLGRVTLITLYLAAGWLAGLGAAGAITAVLGAYFLLLPRSRVLVLVPFPVSLVEVPAVFFLAMWFAVHLLVLVTTPSAFGAFIGALALGAFVARVMRRPLRWEL
jgi:membrane associated rhomboid family serine protease